MRLCNTWKLLRQLLGRATQRRTRPKHKTWLQLESLEARCVPTTMPWTVTPPLPLVPVPNGQPVPDHPDTMLLLSDGPVMVHGDVAFDPNGTSDSCSAAWYKLTPDSMGNYFDGTWTTLTPMNMARGAFSSDVLSDGRVLVIGGEYSGPYGGKPRPTPARFSIQRPITAWGAGRTSPRSPWKQTTSAA